MEIYKSKIDLMDQMLVAFYLFFLSFNLLFEQLITAKKRCLHLFKLDNILLKNESFDILMAFNYIFNM